MLLHHVQDGHGPGMAQMSAAAQDNALGHLVKCARETPCWQQLYKFPPPLLLDFASFRAPYFSHVNNCDAKYQTSKQSTLFFDPRKTPINEVHMSQGANWVEGERHSVALRVENPLGANVSIISAYLELRGSECIVHEHLFDKVVLKGRSSAPILLDATPILQENAIKLSGAWITMMDDNGDSFSSFHGIEVIRPASRQNTERIFKFNSTQFFLCRTKIEDSTQQKSGPVSQIISVVPPEPRIIVRVVSVKSSSLENDPTDYMTVGVRSGEDIAFKLQLTNVSEVRVDRLELWAGPLQSAHRNDLIFRYVLNTQSNKSDTKSQPCAILNEDEKVKLRRQLHNGSKSLSVLMHIGHNPMARLLGARVTCMFAGAGEVQRNAGVAVMLTPRPGLTCICVKRYADYLLYHVRNDADIPIRLKRCSYDTWAVVRPRAPMVRLRLFINDTGKDIEYINKLIQWRIDGAVKSELDGIGFLSYDSS